MSTLLQLVSTSMLGIQRDSLLSIKLCRSLVSGIQLEISRVNTDGGVDSQRKLKFFPSLCEGSDELDEPPLPNGPRKNFDKDLFPKTTESGNKKTRSDAYSLEIRVAGVCALLDISCNGFTELLHSSLDSLAIRRDLFGIGDIF